MCTQIDWQTAFSVIWVEWAATWLCFCCIGTGAPSWKPVGTPAKRKFHFIYKSYRISFKTPVFYLVKYGVEYRIHHRTRISQPSHHVKDPRTYFRLALGTKNWQQVEHKKRRPQNYKREEYDAQHLGGFLLESDYATVPWWVSGYYARVSWVMRSNGGGALEDAGGGRL